MYHVWQLTIQHFLQIMRSLRATIEFRVCLNTDTKANRMDIPSSNAVTHDNNNMQRGLSLQCNTHKKTSLTQRVTTQSPCLSVCRVLQVYLGRSEPGWLH